MRIGILALALVAAGLAAFLARSLVTAEQPQVAAPQIMEEPMAEVLVAANDIAIGQRVGKSEIAWQRWPQQAVSSAYVTRDVQPNAMEVFAGAIARGPLLAGEPVTPGKLVSFENAGFMSALLSSGMRAVSTKISPETGAGGFILPNDRVDIIVTIRSRGGDGMEGGSRESFRSETILSNVRVLAIDQTFQEVEDEQVVVGKTATLELLPEQAEEFALAEAQGTISLALRPLADISSAGKVPVSGTTRERNGRTSQQGTTVRIMRFGAESSVSTVAGRGQ